MSKTLTWFIAGAVGTRSTAPAFRMDSNYKVTHVWAQVENAPSGSNLIFDIREDGTSLFSATKPSVVKGNTEMHDRDVIYTSNMLDEGTVITLAILTADSGGTARDLTVQMDLEEITA